MRQRSKQYSLPGMLITEDLQNGGLAQGSEQLRLAVNVSRRTIPHQACRWVVRLPVRRPRSGCREAFESLLGVLNLVGSNIWRIHQRVGGVEAQPAKRFLALVHRRRLHQEPRIHAID